MLFTIIEHFRDGNARPVYERSRQRGPLAPYARAGRAAFAVLGALVVIVALTSVVLAACNGTARTTPPAAATAATVPATGTAVLERMHDRYDGRWYTTLHFKQKTTRYAPDGGTAVSTWYETLQHTADRGTLLRIDFGAPSEGNGVLYSVDSSVRVRDGRVTARRGDGNPFLPLIEGVYVQPVETTARQVRALGIDLDRVYARDWEGGRVWVVGASSASDSTSPQIWVDLTRLVVTRAIVPTASGQPPLDIFLEAYEPAGQGWLATRVRMLVNGKPVQTEEYSEWQADAKLPAGMFDREHWIVPEHWATQTP